MPGRPAHHVTGADIDYSILPQPQAPAGQWNANPGGSPNLSLHLQPTDPQSPASTLRVRWREGMDGVAPLLAWVRPQGGQGHRELYLATWRYIPADYVNHAVGNKDFFILADSHNNSPYTGFGNRDMRIGFFFQGENWGNRNVHANRGPEEFRRIGNLRDRWIRIEYLFGVNTIDHLPGNERLSNGYVYAWVTADRGDGVVERHLVMEHTDLRWFRIDANGQYWRSDRGGWRQNSGRIDHVRWSNTYGGKGSPAPRDMHDYYGHFYMSGGARPDED